MKEIEREYTIDEIAILTRNAPARLLGLRSHGQLAVGAAADLAFYEPLGDWESTFTKPVSVWKSGCEINRSGSFMDCAPTRSMRARLSRPAMLDARWQDSVEQSLRMSVAALQLGDDEFQERMLTSGRDTIYDVGSVAL